MAKKKNVSEPEKRICDDCMFSEWVTGHENMDLNGKPICLTCPERQYMFVRGRIACDKWKAKSKNQ